MRIRMEKALAAAGVGLVDFAGEKYLADKKVGPVSGSDALKFGVATAAFLVNYFNYETEYSEPIFYASLPLVVKAVANMASGGTTTQRVQRIQVIKTAAPAPTVTVGAAVPP